MPTFDSTLVIPSLPTHVRRGGGPSVLLIECESDYSAAASGAEWNALTILQSKSDNVAESAAGGRQDLTLQLVHGPRHVLKDSEFDSAEDQETKALVIAMSDMYTFSIRRWTKGKRFFIVDPVLLTPTTKIVQFGFGYFERTFTRNHDYAQIIATNATFRFEPHGQTSPTFPALPTNADPLFTTDPANMEYLGWLLAAADDDKGGFGNAVTLPTTSELAADMPSVELEF
ncbi:MAG: hypothetical protein M5R41_10340 [Bacteroidia bacterium]|nr:hypothetical protein [Bacteroidia bacterium]